MNATTPPLLPAAALQRAARLARIDGTTVLIVAGVFTLSSALMQDGMGAAISLAAMLAGAGERHGGRRLQQRASAGIVWLVASQLGLLLLIWAYAAWRYTHYDPRLLVTIMEPLLRSRLEEAFLTMDDLAPALLLSHQLTYLLLALLSLGYQGGLAWYYARQQRHLDRPAP